MRIFPIAYGEGADTAALQRIAEATGGQWFDASDADEDRSRLRLRHQQLLIPKAASVSDYDVSAAVKALTSSDVFVDGEATLSHQSQIESAFRDDHIAVAVLPDGANSTLSANQLADQIKTGTAGKYDTVIVVIDSGQDTYGVASSHDASAITSALYGANNPDGGEAIMAASNTIASMGHPVLHDSGTNLVVVGGGVLGLAVLGAAVVFLFRKFAGRSLRTRCSSDCRPNCTSRWRRSRN